MIQEGTNKHTKENKKKIKEKTREGGWAQIMQGFAREGKD